MVAVIGIIAFTSIGLGKAFQSKNGGGAQMFVVFKASLDSHSLKIGNFLKRAMCSSTGD